MIARGYVSSSSETILLVLFLHPGSTARLKDHRDRTLVIFSSNCGTMMKYIAASLSASTASKILGYFFPTIPSSHASVQFIVYKIHNLRLEW